MSYFNELKRKKITIVGLGFSGFSAARFFLNNNIKVFISDNAKKLSEDGLKLVAKYNVEYETGKHTDRILNSDLIFLSPGVPRTLPILKKAEEKGIEFINDVELLYRILPQKKIVAVTGSNGKTTTTRLIGEIFKSHYRTWIGGNIGRPIMSIFEDKKYRKIDLIVLELSNFQLEIIKQFKPFISVILNITPDHLDRYNSFKDYSQAKLRIFSNQDENDFLILNKDDQLLDHINARPNTIGFSLCRRERCYFENSIVYYSGEKIIQKNELIIRGNHNIQNVMAAIIAAKIVNVPTNKIVRVLKGFKGIEHRLEFVGELNGVKYFNDSKATNPDSVLAALRSFKSNIIWLAGGRDKNTAFNSVKEEAKSRVKDAVFFGEAANKFFNFFSDTLRCVKKSSLEDALRLAYKIASTGDVILLSPGCTSFDAFNSYEERGEHFKRMFAELKNQQENI